MCTEKGQSFSLKKSYSCSLIPPFATYGSFLTRLCLVLSSYLLSGPVYTRDTFSLHDLWSYILVGSTEKSYSSALLILNSNSYSQHRAELDILIYSCLYLEMALCITILLLLHITHSCLIIFGLFMQEATRDHILSKTFNKTMRLNVYFPTYLEFINVVSIGIRVNFLNSSW